MAKKKAKTKTAAPKVAKLTPQQEQFCQHFAKHRNATDAYRHAYATSSKSNPKTIHVEACRLLQHPNCAPRIEELTARIQEIADKEFDVDVRDILFRLKLLGFASLKDYIDINPTTGEPTVKLLKTTDDQFYALNEVTIEDIEQGPRKGKRTKVKMADRIAALTKLYQHKTGNKTVVELTGKNGAPIAVAGSVVDISKSVDPKEALKLFEAHRLALAATK